VQVGETTDPKQFDTLLREVQTAGDSIGGVVECKVDGLPVGVGEPLFDKLQARLAYAMMSINGCKGFEYGTGFSDMHKRGSELYIQGEVPCAASGGIEGGISNGLTLTFRCAFKPAATIRSLYKGRHDSCIAIRAVPVVEAMTALVLADYGIAD
jgi:chorismate synthase